MASQRRTIDSARRVRITRELTTLGKRRFTFERCPAIRGLVVVISRADKIDMPEHTRGILENRHEEKIRSAVEGKNLHGKVRAVEAYLISLGLRQRKSTFRTQMPDVDSWG